MKRRRGRETETDRWRGAVRHKDKLSHNISEEYRNQCPAQAVLITPNHVKIQHAFANRNLWQYPGRLSFKRKYYIVTLMRAE